MTSSASALLSASEEPCSLLSVKVKCGRKITKSYLRDLIDTPDPYVVLSVPTDPINTVQETVAKANDCNPVWDEEKTFVILDPRAHNTLELKLMESDYARDNQYGDTHVIEITSETYGHGWVAKTIDFNGHGEVDIEIYLRFDVPPTVTYTSHLSPDEKAFVAARRQKVFEAVKRLLGNDPDAPKTVEECPNIGMLCSGGGYRAMIGQFGAFKALTATGLFDCISHIFSLSGSTWATSIFYSNDKWPGERSIADVIDEIRPNVQRTYLSHFTPSKIKDYVYELRRKSDAGQPTSFTDVFSLMLGEQLVPDRYRHSKLSDQKVKIRDAQLPLPVYSAIHVKPDTSVFQFCEWIEFSPLQIGIACNGCFIPPEVFGSKFYKGRIIRKFEEPLLCFLQGTWGSAFCILTKDLIGQNQNDVHIAMDKLKTNDPKSEQEVRKVLQELSERTKANEPIFDIQDFNEKQAAAAKDESIWSKFKFELASAQSLINTTEHRAAKVFNYLLSRLAHLAHLDTTDSSQTEKPEDLHSQYSMSVEEMTMVDAGISCNLPVPLVYRNGRDIDVILTYDYSGRVADEIAPFEELAYCADWAQRNHCKFPAIEKNLTEYERDGLKECYVFKDEKDDACPLVVQLPLVNKSFRELKAPGKPRTTPEEREFANFNLFTNEEAYSSFSFKYTELEYDRLWQLTEFNTLFSLERIKETLKEAVRRKRRCLAAGIKRE